MANDSSLKEYYIKLLKMYNDAVSMLTAINQSLYSSSSEITVNVGDTDDAQSTVKIPSFLYLESRLEQLESTMSSMFNLPEDGEAWFTNANNMYKLNLVRSNTAPLSPEFLTDGIYAFITDNNILKDMVAPKTFLKINIDNLPDNVNKMFMRKIVILNADLYNALRNLNIATYSEYKAALYNMRKGVDYEEYDSVLDLPIKKEYYNSAFAINQIIDSYTEDATNRLCYKVVLNTLEYSNEEDSSIKYYLRESDYVCLGNEMAVYKVKSVNDNTKEVILEESIGHMTLQTVEGNSQMVFQIYTANYSAYHYVQVPLEENQYIIVFLGTIYNNVRSILSDGYLIDLATILMKDANGRYITDGSGNPYDYMSYYNEFCNNLGDLILGISQTAYPQVSNYTSDELRFLTTDGYIASAATESITGDNVLQVVPINKHLTDDISNEDIRNLHNQKNEINSKLQTCQSNINEVYSTLLTTDFSQNVTVTQVALKEKLDGYYAERTELKKQINALVDNINSKAETLNTVDAGVKYRIRGISNVSVLEQYLDTEYHNVKVVGMDIEYKYKTTLKDTNTLTNINSSVFTDWIKQDSIERQRELRFTSTGYVISFVDYGTNMNIIKWNQIDIPIRNGEDVVIRVRYKYNVGQPFINLYTPWSDEYTVIFPTEFAEDQEINSILATNQKDTVTAAFNQTLINDGYTEHVQNKILSNEQVFFHMPENIYSGFNTSENNLISLKDKLTSMVNDIEKYKKFIDNITNSSFEVYLTYDDKQVLLSPNTINKINIFNTDHITDMFIKKNMNIVIKNTGDVKLSLYSIFPGNTDIPLIVDKQDGYISKKGNYERVPIFINNMLDCQYLGQWIYFRSNNPYTSEDIYFNNKKQNLQDLATHISSTNSTIIPAPLPEISFIQKPNEYMYTNNSQVLLGYKNDNVIAKFDPYTPFIFAVQSSESTDILEILNNYNQNTELINKGYAKLQHVYDKASVFFYKGRDIPSTVDNNGLAYVNNYVVRYEDIKGMSQSGDVVTLDSSTSLSTFNSTYGEYNILDNFKNDSTAGSSITGYAGAFLYLDAIAKAQLLVDDFTENAKTVLAGNSISVPVKFEYYVEADTNDNGTVTKSLYFDIRNSLINEPIHYMVEVTGNYDFTSSGDIYKNIDTVLE